MLKFSCFITGDDYKMLKAETPQSKKKVKSLASVLFIPVILWIAIGYLMVSVVLSGEKGNALLVSGILGSIIFIIERNIIMAPNTRSIKNLRYTLGAIIALLGAVCLDEVVFKNDIDQQMFEMRQEAIQENQNDIDNLNGANLILLRNDRDLKYTTWQTALNDAKKEADGSGGSGITGVHAIATLKLNAAEECKQDYDKSVQKYEDAKTTVELQKSSMVNVLEENMSENALLNRIKALFHLVFSDWAMATIYFLFTALLFIMEFLVVFLKGALPETNYERKLQMIEEVGRKRMERILQLDQVNFDAASVSPEYRKAKELLKTNSSSLYN